MGVDDELDRLRAQRNAADDERARAERQKLVDAAGFIASLVDALKWAEANGVRRSLVASEEPSPSRHANWNNTVRSWRGERVVAFCSHGGHTFVLGEGEDLHLAHRVNRLERKAFRREKLLEGGYAVRERVDVDHPMFTVSKAAHGPQGYEIWDHHRTVLTNAYRDPYDGPYCVTLDAALEVIMRGLAANQPVPGS